MNTVHLGRTKHCTIDFKITIWNINYMIHNNNAIDSINKIITKLTERDNNI